MDSFNFWDRSSENAERRLDFVVEMMREMSQQTQPQRMVQLYVQRMRNILTSDAHVSLSRRDLDRPKYRVTRSRKWGDAINPWILKDKLPAYETGIFGELIYADEPRIIDDFRPDPNDPAFEHMAGMRSLVAVPLFDRGVALNMVVLMRKEPNGFPHDRLPEHVWLSNLFGRATTNLVLSEELRRAYEMVDAELKVVEDIQRSLLPRELPRIPTLDLAVHYQTSRRAGGDYYDFFPLPSGRWGILIADVSGHGTPAAVLMAITHSIAHTLADPPTPPSRLLTFVNEHLCRRYTEDSGNFVTAFYGIYDPATHSMKYSSAGHCPPRVKRCADGSLMNLDQAQALPLGIDPEEKYIDRDFTFVRGDGVLFYTDGITEARNAAAELFGVARLDDVLEQCTINAKSLVEETLAAVHRFAGPTPLPDDQTLVAARVL